MHASGAQDLHGEPLLIEASGLEARVLQHEMDHLDGILILDRTPREQRRAALRALRNGEQFDPSMLEADDEPTPDSSEAIRALLLSPMTWLRVRIAATAGWLTTAWRISESLIVHNIP